MNPTPALPPDKTKSKWTWAHTAGSFALLTAIVLVGLGTPAWDRIWVWLAIMLLLLAFALVAGHGVVGRWTGLLIDERNKMSLSRLQMVMWTILILSGFLAVALVNIRLVPPQPEPLAIHIPQELWLLMGISTTSLVGSPLLKSRKQDREPEDAERQRTLGLIAKRGVNMDDVQTNGQVVVNARTEDAGWSDLFSGEETGNAAQLDLGKVQMFYFTVVLVLAYAVALGNALHNSAGLITEFPAIDSGMVTLLGISHAGYLANKAVPHSKTGDTP